MIIWVCVDFDSMCKYWTKHFHRERFKAYSEAIVCVLMHTQGIHKAYTRYTQGTYKAYTKGILLYIIFIYNFYIYLFLFISFKLLNKKFEFVNFNRRKQ